MKRDKFRVVIKGLIVDSSGKVLIGRKEESDVHPVSGQFHIIGGHLEKGETPEECLAREIKEEAGIDVDVKNVIEVRAFQWTNEGGLTDSLQLLYFCEKKDGNAEASSDLEEIKWVRPENLQEQLGEVEAERFMKSDKQQSFVQKLISENS